MHYLQDLAQPFHSVQILNFKMVPWYELLAWPPKKGFDRLVQETTRIVTNYHWAYEDYIQFQISLGNNSAFRECLTFPEKFSSLKMNSATQTPEEMALEVVDSSIDLAAKLGPLLFDFFGSQLTEPGINLSLHPEMLNYKDYSIRPDLLEARQKLHSVTCECLANAALGSRSLLEWALQP